MTILLVCERLSGAGDEGIKNLAAALARELGRHGRLIALTRRSGGEARGGAIALPMNSYFLNPGLLRAARGARADVVLYVPWTSGTARTFWRARILRLAAGAPVTMFLTQPYAAPAWERWAMRRLRPARILAQSGRVVADMAALGIESRFMPSGVDLERFVPLAPAEREAARRELGVAPAERLVLHVGHLNRMRLDAGELCRIAAGPGTKLAVVGSTDTPQDTELVSALRARGVRVIGEYVPRIERLIGAADVYLFPTRATRSSIGVPLSVLEALACGIPVVSTPFEGLPDLFPDCPWVRYGSSAADFEAAIAAAPSAPAAGARERVLPLSWEKVGSLVRAELEAAARTDAPH
jgi:glycosyltransferase involved in cell wall biosynthesis